MPINQLKTVISLLNKGEIEEALSVAEEIIDLKYRDSAFAFIAEDYRANKNYEQFVNIVKRISNTEKKILLRNTEKKMRLILSCVEELEQKEIASELLNKAYTIFGSDRVKQVEYQNDYESGYMFVSNIVMAYAEIGNYKRSLQITELISDKWSKNILILDIVKRIDERDVVSDLLNQIYAMLQEIKNKDYFIKNIANEYGRIGDYKNAFKIFGELSKKTETSGITFFHRMLNSAKKIDSAFLKSALRCVNSRKDNRTKDYWAYLIIEGLFPKIEIQQVFEFIDSIQTNSLNKLPMCNIIRHHTNRAAFKQAIKKMKKKTARQKERLIYLAGFFSKNDKPSQALKLLAITYRLLNSDKKSHIPIYLLRWLIHPYKNLKLPKMVKHINKLIDNCYEKLDKPKEILKRITFFGIGETGELAVQYIINQKDENNNDTRFYTISTDSNTIKTIDNYTDSLFSEEYNKHYTHPKNTSFSLENIELLINTPMLFIATDYKTVNEGEMIFNILEVAQKKGAASFIIVNINTNSNQTIYKAQQSQSIKKLQQIADTLVLIPDNPQMPCNTQDKENMSYCSRYEQICSHTLLCISDFYLIISSIQLYWIMKNNALGALGSGLARGKRKEIIAILEAISELSITTGIPATTILENATGIFCIGQSCDYMEEEELFLASIANDNCIVHFIRNRNDDDDCERALGFIPDDASDIFQITILATGLGDLCQYPAKETSKKRA